VPVGSPIGGLLPQLLVRRTSLVRVRHADFQGRQKQLARGKVSAWEGLRLDTPWLMSSKHVAYPAEGAYDQGGKCPDTHPKRIPSLFYEIFYHVRILRIPRVKWLTPRTSTRVRSMCPTLACSPMETISDALCTVSHHDPNTRDSSADSCLGDFLNGWPDDSFLSDVFATCGNVGDVLEDCRMSPHLTSCRVRR